jgi:glucose-6-phosphate 1-dehydrogenase
MADGTIAGVVPARVECVTPTTTPERPTRLAPPCAFVVFGGTGDLTRRKLMPAIVSLMCKGFIEEGFAVIGVARRELSRDAFADVVIKGIQEFAPDLMKQREQVESLKRRLDYVSGEFGDPAVYERLKAALERADREHGTDGNRLFYLATPPSEFDDILTRLKAAGMIADPTQHQWTRVVIEKPFGHDLTTAMELNRLVSRVLAESQTFRIDHYLGKETVQNILVFRFANSIFEPLWNRKYVDYVEISALETVGVERRGAFYEETGVLRDIVQNHLLEVLALTCMEPPTTGSPDDVRNAKLEVLRSMREQWADTIPRNVVLGQYRGYRQEPDVAPDSVTPTYAALRVFVDNWRWQGVPFYLRAGKKLKQRLTEVSLHLQRVPLALFGREDVCENLEPNVLTLRIQPNEGIRLSFASKRPGFDRSVGTVAMDMTYVEAFGGEPPEAYERLLLDAMRGDATLFSRRDAVEQSWRWITPILQHIDAFPTQDAPNYEPGSWGPAAAEHLIQRDGHAWSIS